MEQNAIHRHVSEETKQAVMSSGYRAQAEGKNLVNDNPYPATDERHWMWRKGFVEATADSSAEW